jgi:hypothetical protein
MRLPLIVALTALDVIFCRGVSAQAPAPDRKTAPAAGVKATVELSTGITVTRGWQSRLGLEETGGKEVSMIFSGVAKPTIEGTNPKDLIIYPGVQWLMSFEDAIKAMGLKKQLGGYSMLPSAVLPQGSFSFASFDGSFEDGFPHLMLVLDSARKVVCVQLEDFAVKRGDSARSEPSVSSGTSVLRVPTFSGARPTFSGAESDWHYYNYLRMGGKASTTLEVKHYLTTDTKQSAPLILNSILQERGGGKILQRYRLYLPMPLAELMLKYNIPVQNGSPK